MRLYEYEGKKMLAAYGVAVPKQIALIESGTSVGNPVGYPVMGKLQVLSAKRATQGGIALLKSEAELRKFYKAMNGRVLIEEHIEPIVQNLYVSILYLPDGLPYVLLSQGGGSNIESQSSTMLTVPIDILTQHMTPTKIETLNLPEREKRSVEKLLQKLIVCFFAEDCASLEINPLALTPHNDWIALDAKITLDDRAIFRHPDRTHETLTMRPTPSFTQREQAVQTLNQHREYGGTPCRYTELDGDVILLLSGGGASMVVFDALTELGVRPGNYSEYSGNPRKEKVEALTRIALGKPNQKGLLIAGAIANFTMIDETMTGIAAALIEAKPSYPIVIRRGGPNEGRAKIMMEDLARKHHLNIMWLGSKKTLLQATQIFAKKIL